MNNYKSYTFYIDANKSKKEFIISILNCLDKISEEIYDLLILYSEAYPIVKRENGIIFPIGEEKYLYDYFSNKYQNINPRFIENLLYIYKRKKMIKSRIKGSIYIFQDFNIKISNCKIFDAWLTINDKSLPLINKSVKNIIKNHENIRQIQIYDDNNSDLFGRITIEKQL